MAAVVAHTVAAIPSGATPTAAQTKAFVASIYAAARSQNSHRGGGLLGHVGAVMPAALYQAMANTLPWVDPVPPVQPLVIPAGTNAAVTAVMVRQHTADLEEFSQYITNMNILRSLVLDNIDNTLIGHLRDPMLNFASVHPRDMIQHLLATYAAVTADELEENAAALRAAWDPSQPIVGLWARQTQLQLFSVGHDDISWPTVVRTTVGILEAMGIYPETIREWRMRNPQHHTWANLLADFNHADQEFRRQATVSTQHYANIATAGRPTPASTVAAPGFPHYCFTHGVTWLAIHASPNCDHPCEGHQATATIENMMGGNNTIRRRPDQPPHPAAQPRRRPPRNGGNQAGAPAPP